MISWLYEKITDFRNRLYEKSALKSFSLGAKAVSVGNLTVGGTGKTPLVAYVAEILIESGEKVCILTRGHGRENAKKRVLVSDGASILTDAKLGGDEPLELARRLCGKAIIIADADRVAAARWAREKFGATAFVLDDAFQHRRAKRDLDIVCIDATNPFGNRKTLPAGILRESVKNLERADLIVVSRANLIENAKYLKTEIRKYNASCSIFVSENVISNLIEIKEFDAKSQKHKNAKNGIEQQTNADESTVLTDKEDFGFGNLDFRLRKALAFCALGNPENFYEQLRRESFNLTATETFPDHYFYRQTDIEKLDKTAEKTGAEMFLTTAKDAVKLKDLKFNTPCYVVETELRFDDEKSFREIIVNVTQGS